MISAQLYTVRKLLQSKSKSVIEKVLASIKSMGYEGVQLSGIGEVDQRLASLYAEVCQKLDLKIVATHFSLEALESQLDEIIEYHKMWQCQYIGVGSMPKNLRNEKRLDEFIQRMDSIAEKLKPHNMKLIYHNHKFEFEKVDNETWMTQLLKGLQVAEFEIDTFWLQYGGVQPTKWIRKVAGKMDVIHLKDYKIVDDQVMFAALGEGNLDFQEIIQVAMETGVKHFIVEQDESEDPLKSLSLSINYLHQFM